jgi:hypothetical protein
VCGGKVKCCQGNPPQAENLQRQILIHKNYIGLPAFALILYFQNISE